MSIASRQENDYVAGLIGSRHTNIWIGYNDRETEGTWAWSDGSSTKMYTNWIPGNPNNANGQDCAVINIQKGTRKWDDQGCEYKEVFACKIGEERFNF